MRNTQHFNGLTEAQAERLTLLSEECAEVIQVIAKIQRHGYESFDPRKPDTINLGLLEKEIGHVLNAINMMYERCDIQACNVDIHTVAKHASIPKWLHHQ